MENFRKFFHQIFNDTNVNWLGIAVFLGTVLSFGLLFFYATITIASGISQLFSV